MMLLCYDQRYWRYTALSTVENNIHNVSNLIKNIDYNTKINEIKKKTDNDHSALRLAQAYLASRIDIAVLVENTYFMIK